MSAEDGRLIVYRAPTRLGRARTFHVDVDGTERGTVRGSQRLEIAVDAGLHAVVSRYGPRRSKSVQVEALTGEPTFLAIDFEADQDPNSVDQYQMIVRVTDGSREKSNADRRVRPAIGNPRSRAEKWFYALGIVFLFGGFLLGKIVNQAAGLGPQIVGLVIVVVLFFRSLRYKGV